MSPGQRHQLCQVLSNNYKQKVIASTDNYGLRNPDLQEIEDALGELWEQVGRTDPP